MYTEITAVGIDFNKAFYIWQLIFSSFSHIFSIIYVFIYPTLEKNKPNQYKALFINSAAAILNNIKSHRKEETFATRTKNCFIQGRRTLFRIRGYSLVFTGINEVKWCESAILSRSAEDRKTGRILCLEHSRDAGRVESNSTRVLSVDLGIDEKMSFHRRKQPFLKRSRAQRKFKSG